MFMRVLDLDGSINFQKDLLRRHQPVRHDLQGWGPKLRLACTWRTFSRFEKALTGCCQGEEEAGPVVTLFGSGDFHHVALALLRRLRQPCNLLVLDKHPDWVRGIPFLHCGTWLYHAARLPQVQQVFHVGGVTDFDNAFRWLAPWRLLQEGKITLFPASQYFQRGRWGEIAHEPVRRPANQPVLPGRLRELLRPFRAQLQKFPLYISVDKDVLVPQQATVNWDSGHLTLDEVETILTTFREMANDEVIGVDILGDWSPVVVQGLCRRLLHLVEHPPLTVAQKDATRLNQEANMRLLDGMPVWGEACVSGPLSVGKG